MFNLLHHSMVENCLKSTSVTKVALKVAIMKK